MFELTLVCTFVYGAKVAETRSQWRQMMGWDCLPSTELVLFVTLTTMVYSVLSCQQQ